MSAMNEGYRIWLAPKAGSWSDLGAGDTAPGYPYLIRFEMLASEAFASDQVHIRTDTGYIGVRPRACSMSLQTRPMTTARREWTHPHLPREWLVVVVCVTDSDLGSRFRTKCGGYKTQCPDRRASAHAQ